MLSGQFSRTALGAGLDTFAYRLERKDGLRVFEVDHPATQDRIETKPYAPDFRAGDRLAFDLRVNATVARKGNVDAKGRSRRSDVAMDRMRAEEAAGSDIGERAERRLNAAESAAAEWLLRIGERDRFALKAARLEAYRVETLPRRGRGAEIGVSDVRGALEVTNDKHFLARLLAGFGRAKAFGCGLMLLRRVQ
jgi:CRISPR system Cascade subunit CasE